MSRERFDAEAAARALSRSRRILVLGTGGAGKSTAARELASLLDLPLHHLDTLFWQPGWQPTADSEWEEMQQSLVRAESWVIDGNYSGTLRIRLSRADGVLFLDLPREISLWRAFTRALRSYGRVRADMAPGCPEHLDIEFFTWIWNFPRRSRGTLLAAQAAAPAGQAWVVARTPGEVRRLFEQMRRAAAMGSGRHGT